MQRRLPVQTRCKRPQPLSMRRPHATGNFNADVSYGYVFTPSGRSNIYESTKRWYYHLKAEMF